MADRGVRLFISCVSDEFGAYRDALRHALTRPNVEVKIQEDFQAPRGDTLHMLGDYIEQCEAVVHFVGDMAGSAPAASSVDDLLRRRPDVGVRLALKGLGRHALETLTYTQWEAWLTIGLDKELLIVTPTPGVDRGTGHVPSDVSLESQARHLKRLKAIDRYPIAFTSADNLVATILESAVIETLDKARVGPVKEKRREPFGATTAAIVSGLFVLFIDRLLPLEKFFGELPIIVRLLLAVAASLFAWFAWRYWDILSGAGDAQGSRERADYDALLRELHAGGTPAKVYRDWLTNALDRIDVFFGDPGRNDKSWVARVLGLETPGARWTAPAFDRCLLLALLYPFVTIVGVWIWSGHVGVAERALGLWKTLADSPLGLMRSAYGLSLVAAVYAGRRWLLAKRVLASLLWAVACIVAIAFALALAGGGAVVLAVGGAFAFAGAGVGAFAVVVAFGDAVAGTVGDVLSGTVAGVVPDAGAVIFAFAVGLISAWSVETRRHGTFLSLFFLAAVLAAVPFVSGSGGALADGYLPVERTDERRMSSRPVANVAAVVY